MGSIVRYLLTVALAAIITLSAFYLMHRLIDRDGATAVEPPAVTRIHFGPVDVPELPNPTPREKPEKPEPQQPPPTNAVATQVDAIERPLEFDRAPKPGPDGYRILEASINDPRGSASATARPLAAVPPPYPRKAALEGIEGWVRVSVQIDANGRVTDVRVIEAQPRGVFEDAAVNAVRRWSWKPAIIDGEPRAQRVVQELTFSLDDS